MRFLYKFHERGLTISEHKVSKNCYSARQFDLLQVQCNFYNRFSFLNKHQAFSEGFKGASSEKLRKCQTTGHLVFFFSKRYPAAEYGDT